MKSKTRSPLLILLVACVVLATGETGCRGSPGGVPGLVLSALEAALQQQLPQLRPGLTGVAKVEAGSRPLGWLLSHRLVAEAGDNVGRIRRRHVPVQRPLRLDGDQRSYPTLLMTLPNRMVVTMLFHPETHLLRQARTDIKPMLQERGMVGTFYINSGMVGSSGYYMNWSQVLEHFEAVIRTLENALASRLRPERRLGREAVNHRHVPEHQPHPVAAALAMP